MPDALRGPALSVVVPVYNGGTDLPACLSSVEQALAGAPDLVVEVVVSDDRSTDGTAAIAQGYADRLGWRVVRPDEHLDRCAHWDFALSAARGEWLVMLHADDRLTPGSLAAYGRAAADAGPSVVLLSGRYRTLSADESTEGPDRPHWATRSMTVSGEAMRAWVLGVQNPFTPFTAVRRSCYAALGGFDRSYELLQDWDLWYRALGLGDVRFLPETVGLWRQHPVTASYATTFAEEHRRFARRLPALGGSGTAGVLASRLVQSVRARAISGSPVAERALRPALLAASAGFRRARRVPGA